MWWNGATESERGGAWITCNGHRGGLRVKRGGGAGCGGR